MALRLKNNLDHFVKVLQDPDAEPEEREVSWRSISSRRGGTASPLSGVADVSCSTRRVTAP